MKKNKVLTISSLLFLAIGSISAQNDSIYGLNASINDNILDFHFYFTYNRNDLKSVHLNFYDQESSYHLGRIVIYHIYFPTTKQDTFLIEGGHGNGYVQEIEQEKHKMNINNMNLNEFNIDSFHDLEKRKIKMELSVQWQNNVSSSTINIENSNVLVFYFDPQVTTYINKVLENENYTYKYFLLSGIETTEIPSGIPFVEVIYKDSNKININKLIIKQI